MRTPGGHLGYCTNIHPGETWPEVRDNLARYLPLVKRRACDQAPMGIGLRLSAQAAEALANPQELAEFRRFLDDAGVYVFTINGFPYGPFHGTRVKEDVYLPDWRDDARVEYTCRLAGLLAELLPEGEIGTISTVPGAYKPHARREVDAGMIVEQLLRVVGELAAVERRTGRCIALALEPEPCCLLETLDETVRFFRERLHTHHAAATLGHLAGLAPAAAGAAIRRHLGVCLDLCHAAVEFEDADTCLQLLASAGIPLFKMQVTAGLRIPRVGAAEVARLRELGDEVYLHQVVERGDDGLQRYPDIGPACAAGRWRTQPVEWRVHFHVPVFLETLEGFASTQGFVRDVLRLQGQAPSTSHLEVETYTWSVLPAALRARPLDEAIAGELHWVREALG